MKALSIAAILVLTISAACGGTSAEELRFVDEVRTEFPELSFAEASDDWLIAMGRRSCLPGTPSDADAAALMARGMDPGAFSEVAFRTICPRH